MEQHLPKKNQHRLFASVTALIIGFTFWYIFGGSHAAVVTVDLPLCFYHVPTDTHINAPEVISVKLAGKRSELRSLDHDHLAIHIDANILHKGKNLLTITQKELMLPASIRLVEYAPSNPTVELLSHEQRHAARRTET